MIVILNINNQFISKITDSHIKKQKIYKDASGVSEKIDKKSQSKEKKFSIESSNFSFTYKAIVK